MSESADDGADTTPSPDVAGGESPFRANFQRFGRLLAWATLSGMAAGVVVIGLGGRLVMRVLAITSDPSVHGAFTDAGEEINKFTVDGTLGLVIFGGLFGGLVGGWLYGLIRPLLPTDRGARLRACAAIGALVGATVFVNPGERDFSILEPLWLAVVLFVLLSAIFGMAVCVVADRWREFYETAPLRWPQIMGFAPAMVLVLAPPLVLGALIVGAMWAASTGWRRPPWLHRVLRVGVAVIIGLIGAQGVQKITEIEARDVRPSDFERPDF